MKGKWPLLLCICWLLFWTAGTCRAEPAMLKVGAILPLSGPASGIGDTMKAGLVLAEREINARQNELKIEVRFEDTRSETKNAVSAFKRLVDVEGVEIIFTVVSGAAMALKPLAERQRVFLFANVAHPAITQDSSYILRPVDCLPKVVLEPVGRT